jgi:hypothetical protein
MIVNTPDGPVNFPDSMSTDDIQNVLRQKYGFQGGAPSGPASATSAPAQTPPPSPGGAPASSLDPNWKPSGNALWDLLTRPVAQSEGVGQAAKDYGRAIFDTGTFGYGNDIQAALSGNTPEQERAETAAAHNRLGLMDYAANAVGYAPSASLGIAGRLGAGVLGAGAEGAIAGGLGAAGHDQNITQGALTGGVGGLAGGVGSKILNAGAGALANKFGAGPDINAAAGDITSSLKDTRDAAYDKMKGVFYKPDDLLDHLDQTKADIYASDPGGDLVGAAPRSMAALNSLYTRTADTVANPTQTAHGILTTIDKLNDIQRSPGGPENDIAPIIKDRLNTFLQTANPVNPDLGPGDASNMLAAAKAAHQQYANARDLQQAAQSLRGFGQSPTGWAQNTAEAFHPDPNSPAYKALSNIANAGGAPGGQSSYTMTHGFVHPIVEGLALAALPPAVAPAAAAAATFMGIKPLLSKAMGAGSTASQLNSIYKAYPTLTGQQFTPPTGPDPGAALRALILGRAASNQKPF